MIRKKSIGEILFNIFNFIVMTFAVSICLYPLWYILIASFSDASAVSTGKVVFLPEGFNVIAYKKAFA